MATMQVKIMEDNTEVIKEVAVEAVERSLEIIGPV